MKFAASVTPAASADHEHGANFPCSPACADSVASHAPLELTAAAMCSCPAIAVSVFELGAPGSLVAVLPSISSTDPVEVAANHVDCELGFRTLPTSEGFF